MKKNLLSKLFNFIELIVNARIAYNNVKDDPEVAKTTKTFGKRSLVYFLAFLGMAALTGGLIYFCITEDYLFRLNLYAKCSSKFLQK